MDSLKDIYDGNLKDGFYLEEKYPYTEDLRPLAFEYDSSFIDVLFQESIPEYISDVIGSNVKLSHIQVRLAYPYPDKSRSYQEWHRDTHYYGGKFSGSFPPAIKIIFYPHFDNDPEPVLSCIPNSATTVYYDKGVDHSQITEDRKFNLSSSNDTFFIFNTSMLHSTLPVDRKNLRIIYNFTYNHSLDVPSKRCQDIWDWRSRE